jgi:predicted aspartyl protease
MKAVSLLFGALLVAAMHPAAAYQPRYATTTDGQIGVPLTKVQNSYMLTALLDSLSGRRTVNFVLDTGADLVCLPDAMVDDMIRRGELQQSKIGFVRLRNADGHTQITRRFVLWEIDLDGYIIVDVPATDGGAVPLLGQSFLNKFQSYQIDNARQVLVLTWRRSP